MTALAGASRVTLLTFVALVLVTATVGCSSEKKSAPLENAAAEGNTGPPVVFAAGDIADCRSEGDEATAKLLEDTRGTILTLGDNAYEKGSAKDFADCYSPTWGHFKDRTRPAPGNHEYNTEAAEGYFDYFGEAAGDPDKGYYSYDVGAWHLVALNSNCEEVGGCDASSPQVRWLKADLRRHQAACTLAYWHHPLFSSGTKHGNTPAVRPLWEALYEAGADVILSGHEHNYERFAPQDPGGGADPERGIREFVVGTGGGGSHYPILDPIANSEVNNDDTYGVLKLTLRPESYDWRFVPVEGAQFTDSGSARCH